MRRRGRGATRAKEPGGLNTRRADPRGGIAAAGPILVACLGTLIFLRQDLPGEAVGIISTIAGIAGACLKDAFQFEFGSSRGSKEKDGVLSTLARTGP
jgi:hypothetical protein